MPTLPPRPGGKNPLAARVVLDDQSGLDITEAGTKKRLAIYLVRDPQDVPGIASLGPDPLADDFTLQKFQEILEAEGRKQLKGVLRHQGTIAGIGNAYSDEILHVARMSPFKPAATLLDADDDTELVSSTTRSASRSATRSTGRAGSPPASSRRRRSPACGARPDRAVVPGLRRHGPRGLFRRLLPAVLPDLPDRRQAARRPPDVQAAQVRTRPR